MASIAGLTLGILLQVAVPPPKIEYQVSGVGGWGGRIRAGDPAPVLVDLDHLGKEDLEVRLRLSWASTGGAQALSSPGWSTLSGRIGAYHELAFTLPAGARKRITLSMTAPAMDPVSLWAVLMDGRRDRTLAVGELIVRHVPKGRRWVAAVGRAPLQGLDAAGVELSRVMPDELPEEARAYDGLDALLWLDGRPAELRGPAQSAALRAWIEGGGRMIVSRSTSADLASSPLSELLPVRMKAGREFLLLDGIRSLAPPPEGNVVVLETEILRGRALLSQENLPLYVDSEVGRGRVGFLAADLTRPPLLAWPGLERFWTWLLGPPVPPRDPTETLLRAPEAVGSLSLARQSARFPDVEPPQLGLLFGLIVLYVLVVGPFDYLVLKSLKRMEFTWFTFPAYVAGFTALILFSGGAFIQQVAHQREIGVVDFHERGARIRAVAALLSPGDYRYRLGPGVEPVSTNFLHRSLYEDVAAAQTETRILHRGDGPEVESWRLERRSTGLTLYDAPADWPAPLSYRLLGEAAGQASVELRVNDGAAYESGLLVTKDAVYWMDTLAPGTHRLQATRHYASIEAFRQAHGEEFKALSFDGAGWNDPGGVRDERGVLSEEEARRHARRCLIGLGVPPAPRADLEPLGGLARRLDLLPWLSTGGSVLLAWPRNPPALVPLSPVPARRTSVVLHRFFQGASP